MSKLKTLIDINTLKTEDDTKSPLQLHFGHIDRAWSLDGLMDFVLFFFKILHKTSFR